MELLGLIVVLLVTLSQVSSRKQTVSESFEDSKLVPELIPVAPSDLAKVKYYNLEVSPGEEVAPSEVVDEPEVSWDSYTDCLYTLVMLDSDAPCHKNPKSSPYNHWLVVNIPGDDVASGEVLAEYCPPTPPHGSGLHRYTFLVYEQESSLDIDDLELTSYAECRKNFPLTNLTKNHELCDPIAGNYFRARNEMLQIYQP